MFFGVCSQSPPETPNTVVQRPGQKSSGGSLRGHILPLQPPSRRASLGRPARHLHVDDDMPPRHVLARPAFLLAEIGLG